MGRNLRRHQLAVAATAVAAVAVLVLMLVLPRCVAPADVSDAGAKPPESTATSPEAEVTGGVAGAALVAEKNVGYGLVRAYESDEPLVESSAGLLRGYRDRGDCVLVRSGYLDLVGSVWSCTVQMPDAVEVCFVSEGTDGGSTLRVLRMEGAEWGDLDVSSLPGADGS